ncbi:hypothetical protein E6H16_05240 [Candidatus Bathyarchaeota archaeon]|nr:MAG: hypothetical protein E6H16_05240 [Candidatus Bathyarchaeota archaeon]
MRKLLVKLVALETAILGWLTYWLFLIYANNPTVSEGLLNELSRFPQVSYTTIDISIIVIIAVFAIAVALKFDRGLRPGMKLERALQMLESLMKRNLFLEAQIAEIRVDNPATGMITQTTVITPPQLPASTGTVNNDLLRPSSWEKAFRIPIEAGPQTMTTSPAPVTTQRSRPPVEQPLQTEIRTLPVQSTSFDRREDRPLPRSSPQFEAQKWEDSPRKTLETRGIISTSIQPLRRPVVPLAAPTTLSSSGRPPYIPMPAPKTPPVSVITGAVVQLPTTQQVNLKPLTPQQNAPKLGVPAQARPTSKFTPPQAQSTGRFIVPSKPNTPSPSIGQLFQLPRPPAPLAPQQTTQKPATLAPTPANPKASNKRVAKDEEEDQEGNLKAENNDDEDEKAGERLESSDDGEDEASLDEDSE